MPLKILVTAKRVEDPESKIKVKPDGSGIVTEGVNYKVNPFDEIAVEEALRLKEKHGGEVVVLSIGGDKSVTEIRAALAMGVDRGILVKLEGPLDPVIVSALPVRPRSSVSACARIDVSGVLSSCDTLATKLERISAVSLSRCTSRSRKYPESRTAPSKTNRSAPYTAAAGPAACSAKRPSGHCTYRFTKPSPIGTAAVAGAARSVIPAGTLRRDDTAITTGAANEVGDTRVTSHGSSP